MAAQAKFTSDGKLRISSHFLDCLKTKKRLQSEVASLSRRLVQLNLHPSTPTTLTHASLTCNEENNNNIFRVNLHKRNLKKYLLDQQKIIALIENSNKKNFKLTEKQCVKLFGINTILKNREIIKNKQQKNIEFAYI